MSDLHCTINNINGNSDVVEHIEERRAQPLTDKERDLWRDGGTSRITAQGGVDLVANSREAMIIDGEPTKRSDGSVVRTTTLITQHVVPADDNASVSVISSDDIGSHRVSIISDNIEPVAAISTLEPTVEEITLLEENQISSLHQDKNLNIEINNSEKQGCDLIF